jgi:hypothetical protein
MELGQVIMSELPGPNEPFYFTLAEVVGLWPLEDSGRPAGSLAVEALWVGQYLASVEYREFGRGLLAARLARFERSDANELAGRLAAALAVATAADSVLSVHARGAEDYKALVFARDAVVAEFAVVEAGFGISVLPAAEVTGLVVGRYLTASIDSVHLERHSTQGPTVGAAWGRDKGFVLNQQSGEWEPDGNIVFEEAARWLTDRLAEADSRP